DKNISARSLRANTERVDRLTQNRLSDPRFPNKIFFRQLIRPVAYLLGADHLLAGDAERCRTDIELEGCGVLVLVGRPAFRVERRPNGAVGADLGPVAMAAAFVGEGDGY